MVSPELKQYLEDNILPQYNEFDKAHRVDHALRVIEGSIDIAGAQKVNLEMAYTIAAYHDLGLSGGREGHEIRSGEILLADQKLSQWFCLEERLTMKEAVEDHRASKSGEPRSIYGKIVAEADRDLSYEMVLSRSTQYSLSHFPDFAMMQHYDRTYNHMREKYGENGYLKLWLATEKNLRELSVIRERLRFPEVFLEDFQECYARLETPF